MWAVNRNNGKQLGHVQTLKHKQVKEFDIV